MSEVSRFRNPFPHLALGLMLSGLVGCAPQDFKANVSGHVMLKQGSKVTLPVSVVRDKGLKGPITVSIRGLPTGVKVQPLVLPESKTSGVLSLQASANAALSSLSQSSSTAQPPSSPSAMPAEASLPRVMFVAGDKTHEVPLDLKVLPLSGSLDKSFGDNGVLRYKMGVSRKNDHGFILATTRDEKILIGGQKNERFAIVRLNKDGTVDKSFGKEGTAIAPAVKGQIRRIIVLSDESIIGIGQKYNLNGSISMAKFQKNGEPDPSFGKNGQVSFNLKEYKFHGVYDAKLRGKDRIVICGFVASNIDESGDLTDSKALLAQFNADGSLDRSFGTAGRVIGSARAYGEAMDLDVSHPESILVVGTTYPEYSDTEWNNTFYLARYLNDGSLDTSFGNNGFVTYLPKEEYTHVTGQGVVRLKDGKIFTTSKIHHYDDEDEHVYRIRVAQYLPDGSKDADFGEDGSQLVDFGFSASPSNSIVLSADGPLFFGYIQPDKASQEAPFLMKFDSSGQPDSSFSFDGRVGVGGLSGPLKPVLLKNGQILAGTKLVGDNDKDENADAAKVNIELVKVNP